MPGRVVKTFQRGLEIIQVGVELFPQALSWSTDFNLSRTNMFTVVLVEEICATSPMSSCILRIPSSTQQHAYCIPIIWSNAHQWEEQTVELKTSAWWALRRPQVVQNFSTYSIYSALLTSPVLAGLPPAAVPNGLHQRAWGTALGRPQPSLLTWRWLRNEASCRASQ